MDRDVGHGAGSGLADIIDKYARMYTFIETELGMR
jgi:prolyl oligopeptidase PreP (S9A serine peptidase family)